MLCNLRYGRLYLPRIGHIRAHDDLGHTGAVCNHQPKVGRTPCLSFPTSSTSTRANSHCVGKHFLGAEAAHDTDTLTADSTIEPCQTHYNATKIQCSLVITNGAPFGPQLKEKVFAPKDQKKKKKAIKTPASLVFPLNLLSASMG